MYTIEEAQERFGELIERVMKGEEVIITCEGVPIAKIIPIEPLNSSHLDEGTSGEYAKRLASRDSMKGEITLLEGWDSPMTDEELAEWYDGPIFPE
jgi:prevent-host-death family protein